MVAQRFKKLAQEMIDNEDGRRIMVKLREGAGTNLTKLKNDFYGVKRALYEMDPPPYHPDYKILMDAKREELVSSADLERVRALTQFAENTLQRQLQIQAKVQRGDCDLFKHETDFRFIMELPIIAAYIKEDFQLTHEDQRRIRSIEQERGAARGSNVVHVEHVDDLIARCRQWLVSSEKPMELATALALVTGRRPVEILQEAIFTPDGSTDNYRVMFKGQVKKGLNDINSLDPADDGVPAFRIPVLAPRCNVIRALQRLRQLEDTSHLTHIQVNNKYAGKLNDFVKATIHPGLVFKDLRALYLKLTFELCKPHSYGINDFGQRVLGHDAVFMSTHYTRIQVSGLTQRYHRQCGLHFVL